jgi:hypothetical protein
MTGLFGFETYGIAINPADLCPVTPADLQKRAVEQAVLAQQCRPTLEDELRTMNYRSPVRVPQGWMDWYEHAEDMP